MRQIQPYSVNKLEISQELAAVQQYFPISEYDREKLKADIKRDGIRDPLKVYTDKNGKVCILAGANRLEIAKELNLQTIDVDFYNDLKPAARKLLAINDNLARRHLSPKQKKIIAELLLKESPTASSRSIGKKAGLSHKTVESMRKKSTGENTQLKRIGADGRQRKLPGKSKKKQSGKKQSTYIDQRLIADINRKMFDIVKELKKANDKTRVKAIQVLKEHIAKLKRMF